MSRSGEFILGDILDAMNLNSSNILVTISNITTVGIMALVAFRSLIDVAHGMGFLPDKIYRFFYKNEEKRVKRLLNDIGVLPRKAHLMTLTSYLDNPNLKPTPIDQIKKEFSSIAKSFVEKEELIIGASSKIKVNYFLSLRKAFSMGQDVNLSRLMVEFILNEFKNKDVVFDCIVSRKSALDLVGYNLSKTFNVPLILYHDQRSILQGTEVKYFDYIPEVKKPIIVDDSCAGGDSIQKMAQCLRDEGLEVSDVFCFFIRSEMDLKKIKDMNLNLHFLEQYDDKQLKKLKGYFSTKHS